MKLDLLDIDEFVKINRLQEVSNPVIFQRGGIPHSDGLLSNEIFGISLYDRKNRMAYIDLHNHFFHPNAYKAVKSIFRNVDKIIDGSAYYKIDKSGKLIPSEDMDADTGIEFLYNNWEKIKWDTDEDNDVTIGIRQERLDFLKIPKKILFMNKLVVIPVSYRDVISDGKGGGTTNELNTLYSGIIRHVSTVKEEDGFNFQFHASNKIIQNSIMEIYEYFKTKIEKKNGMIRKYLMGKSVCNSTRTVITSKNYHSNNPDDEMISLGYCGLPISQICVLAYPFVLNWVKNFFKKEVFENKDSKSFINSKGEFEPVKLISPEAYFDDKYIDGMINNYIKNPESRFNKIEVPVEGPHKIYMTFVGSTLNNVNQEDSTISNRYMTVTDLLYMACDDSVRDKYAMCTRYPLNDQYGSFMCKVRVISTTKTQIMRTNNTIYKWYPVIDFDADMDHIGTMFIDSQQFSPSYLLGLGGDYDGDQMTIKLLWTQEANAELEKYVNSKKYILNMDGKNMKVVGSEPVQTFYSLTKNPSSDDKTASKTDIDWLLEKSPDYFNADIMNMMFANLKDDNTRKLNGIPKFKATDKFTLPAAKSPTKTAIETTVGRYVLNTGLYKRWLNNYADIIGYINEPVTEGKQGKIEDTIAKALMDDRITVTDMYRWIDYRDWFGLKMHATVTSSYTLPTIKTPPEVTKLKNELVEKYKDRLEKGDVEISEEIEKTLINKTKEIFKGDVGMDLYDSGARGSVKNNLKNIAMYRGVVKNPATGNYDIITNSLMDGMAKKDIPASANSNVIGAYSKSVSTADTGYLSKELLAAMQTEMLNPDPESDCGTKGYIPYEINKGTAKSVMYRYIIGSNGKHILLDEKNIDSYMGKTVKMRSPMMCTGKKLCSRCMGQLFYKLGIENVGLSSSKIATTLTNLNMKKFHDNTVVTIKLDLDNLLI